MQIISRPPPATLSLFVLVIFLVAACSSKEATLTFKHNDVSIRSGTEVVACIAGNIYNNPVINRFPHSFRIHHHEAPAYLYIDYKTDGAKFVFHYTHRRYGVSREINVATREKSWGATNELLSKLMSFDDPVIEEVDYISGEKAEPLWQRIVVTEAISHKPTSKVMTAPLYVDFNFISSSIRSYAVKPGEASRWDADFRRSDSIEYYKRYNISTRSMDVFDGKGAIFYLTKSALMRQTEEALDCRTLDVTQIGDASSVLRGSGTEMAIIRESTTKIGRLKLSNAANRSDGGITLMHGYGNRYFIYAGTGPKPSDATLVVKSIFNENVFQISGAKMPDQQTLSFLYAMMTSVCQMNSPLINVIYADESTGRFEITWEGFLTDGSGKINVQKIQKYLLRLDFRKNQARIDAY